MILRLPVWIYFKVLSPCQAVWPLQHPPTHPCVSALNTHTPLPTTILHLTLGLHRSLLHSLWSLLRSSTFFLFIYSTIQTEYLRYLFTYECVHIVNVNGHINIVSVTKMRIYVIKLIQLCFLFLKYPKNPK